MAHNITITAVEKPEPDIRLAVLALLALARRLQAEADAAPAAPAAEVGGADV
ncbi:MAG TPA: hypothetical protein VFA63_12545 [Pseudonocardiaceae bacterium]|nr:hypothetical protein [Pseudonocardiaceae bacterium]